MEEVFVDAYSLVYPGYMKTVVVHPDAGVGAAILRRGRRRHSYVHGE